MKKLETKHPLIIAGLISGLSVKDISSLLLKVRKIKVKPNQLTQYVNENRILWANKLLDSQSEKNSLNTAIHLKKVKRKRSARLPIPANLVAQTLTIVSTQSSAKAALPKVNHFLLKKGTSELSYDALCRLIRKAKRGWIV